MIFERNFFAYSIILLGAISSTNTSFAWVHNESDKVVWVKPEEDGRKPVKLNPGQKYNEENQDGIAIPDCKPGKVLKTVNRCSVVVGNNCEIKRLSCEGLGANAKQAAMGGWKEKSFLKDHPDWNDLFRVSEKEKI